MQSPAEFLVDDLLELPKERTGDFEPFMADLFDRYIKLVQTIERGSLLGKVLSNRLPTIQAACQGLLKTLHLALSGDRPAAYLELDSTLMALGPHFDSLCPPGDMSEFVNPMYRFRMTESTPFLRKDIFHIPFELPHYIKEMRYSVAGLPCLYMGGSTQVCWMELGKPDLDKVSVSRYFALQGTNLRVLNFGHRSQLLAAQVHLEPHLFNGLSRDTAFVAAQVACWPLIAICSMRVPDRSSPERPEYAIPQLVLEWITKTRAFHGVRFFSTHYDEYIDSPKTYMNYVFPASSISTQGYCVNLKALFQLTEPKTWTELKTLPMAIGIRPYYKMRGQVLLDLEDKFGKVEDSLLKLPTGTF